MRTVALLFGVVAVLVSSHAGPRVTAAPVPKHLMTENPDLAALQGKWTLTGMSLDGTPLPADVLTVVDIAIEFQGNTAVLTMTSQKERVAATVKFDAAAKPRRMTFADEKITDLDGKPVTKAAEKLGTVIYKIEGDTFVLAGRSNGTDKANALAAPDDFNGKPGSNTAALTFKRVKK